MFNKLLHKTFYRYKPSENACYVCQTKPRFLDWHGTSEGYLATDFLPVSIDGVLLSARNGSCGREVHPPYTDIHLGEHAHIISIMIYPSRHISRCCR